MIKAILLALLTVILIILAAPNAFIIQAEGPETLIGAHVEPMTIDEAIEFMTEARDNHRFIYTHPEFINANTGSKEFNEMWVERYEQSIALLEDLNNSINGLGYKERE